MRTEALAGLELRGVYSWRRVGSPYSPLTHTVPGSNLCFPHPACLRAKILPDVDRKARASRRGHARSVHVHRMRAPRKPSQCSVLCMGHRQHAYRDTVVLISLIRYWLWFTCNHRSPHLSLTHPPEGAPGSRVPAMLA